MRISHLTILALLCTASPCWAADDLQRRTWKVDGVDREALLYIPATATTKPTPVLFAFHGHGANMRGWAEKFDCHKHWPEAICVYPQGLPAPGGADPEGKKPGWQHKPEDQGGRDLKFFDAMLDALKKEYKIDEKRIDITGFSNGADFTFVLWAARGKVISAAAPCAGGGEKFVGQLASIPAMIVSGERDPHYKIESERRTIEALKKLNACQEPGEKWNAFCTVYPSSAGKPVGAYIHPEGHKVPAEVPGMIVRFFKELQPKEEENRGR